MPIPNPNAITIAMLNIAAPMPYGPKERPTNGPLSAELSLYSNKQKVEPHELVVSSSKNPISANPKA